jgi:hypothetical protein
VFRRWPPTSARSTSGAPSPHLPAVSVLLRRRKDAETRKQFNLIRSEGCTEMQGFHLSKPGPAHSLEPLFLAQGIEGEGSRQVAAA